MLTSPSKRKQCVGYSSIILATFGTVFGYFLLKQSGNPGKLQNRSLVKVQPLQLQLGFQSS